jgi:hypothetical protein
VYGNTYQSTKCVDATNDVDSPYARNKSRHIYSTATRRRRTDVFTLKQAQTCVDTYVYYIHIHIFGYYLCTYRYMRVVLVNVKYATKRFQIYNTEAENGCEQRPLFSRIRGPPSFPSTKLSIGAWALTLATSCKTLSQYCISAHTCCCHKRKMRPYGQRFPGYTQWLSELR